jgi:ubiquinone biosynthesis protein
VSMAKLLQQLFDTTRRFDMELQPQLVLLQKTMVVVEGVARSLDPDFNIWDASRPVVERWMLDQVGPQAQLRDAADSVASLRRLLRDLPMLMRNAESVSVMLADGGFRLHPDTVRELAEAQRTRARPLSAALWLAAGLLAIMARGLF